MRGNVLVGLLLVLAGAALLLGAALALWLVQDRLRSEFAPGAIRSQHPTSICLAPSPRGETCAPCLPVRVPDPARWCGSKQIVWLDDQLPRPGGP